MFSGKRTLALGLSGEAKERLAELAALSDRVEAGDKAARGELRRALRESSSEVVAEAAELARKGQWALIKTAAAGEPLQEEALLRRLDLMRLEIAGENPSALEGVLTEKIVGTWMLTELLDLLVSAQLAPGGDGKRMAPSALKPYLDWQAQAHRRLLIAGCNEVDPVSLLFGMVHLMRMVVFRVSLLKKHPCAQ